MAIECHSCFEWLMPAMEAYREDWPEVELDIASGFSFDALPALLRGDLDLVVTADPLAGVALTYLPLFSYEARLAIAKEHRLAERGWVLPEDLADETLIVYPVDRERLDVFTQFLAPAGVDPAKVRKAELTPMMVQLVASGRGVCCLPNWALHEYEARGTVVSRSLGEDGIWPNLYAAVRTDQCEAAYLNAFVARARESCFKTLMGIVPADEEVAAPRD